jgi:hypothetical protein
MLRGVYPERAQHDENETSGAMSEAKIVMPQGEL